VSFFSIMKLKTCRSEKKLIGQQPVIIIMTKCIIGLRHKIRLGGIKMNELYAEAGVKRKETAGTYAIRILLIFAAVLLFIISLSNQIMLFVAAIVIVGIFYFFPRLSLEYEYVFCDGQLDFDKIMGKSKRKNALKIDFEQVEVMAPQGSHALDSYNHIKCDVKDFSSGNKEATPYVIIYRQGEKNLKILFEPNEKMLNCIKMKNPRKLVQY
jgi:hypothetical protein